MERKITKRVKVTDVYFDEELYPRIQSNWQTSYIYQQSMIAGSKFPPIVLALYNKKLYLVDGKHRLEATELLKEDSIIADVYTGWNKKKIFEEAVRLNIAHGRTLSPFEKRRIALKLRTLKYSDSNIGELINVPIDKLENFVEQRLVNSLTGQEIVKSELKHLAGQDIDMSVTELQKPMRNVSQVTVLKEVINLVEHKLLDITDEAIVALIFKLKRGLKTNY